MTNDLDAYLSIGYEDGIMGALSRNEADGALPNGTAIVKTNSEDGDGTPDGTRGVVLGSLPASEQAFAEANVPLDMRHPPYFYFVEFADLPKVSIGIMGAKIRKAT
jgi:hypothetical protein